jgi:cytosol alanyl aminopeptidase
LTAAAARTILRGQACGLALAIACTPRVAPQLARSTPPPSPGVNSAPGPIPDPLAPPGLRLPDSTRPVDYSVELEVDPNAAEFSGRVAIRIALSAPTTAIWLHARDLTINTATVGANGATQPARVIWGDRARDLVAIAVARPVGPGPALVEIAYRGIAGDQVGLFRQQAGQRWYAYTDFEPTDARRAFPCFDEPRFKVPWTLTAVVPTADQALSNTPAVASEALDGGRKRVRFARTPPLPSYLVALAVGPFEVVKAAAEPVAIRFIVPKGWQDQVGFAVEAVGPLLQIVVEYLDSSVPYPKLDFVVVPTMNGAMENPGLVTVGAGILLVGNTPSVEQRRQLAMVLAHELAHLWFGDLVTMTWWDDIWLNEGFATWMADKAVAKWQPSWQWELEAVAGGAEAMAIDFHPHVRAVRQPVHSALAISALFDTITYKKGGAVLRMLEGWLGAEQVQRGVRRYIRAHAHGHATLADLARALAPDQPDQVTRVLKSFLDQPGVPTVRVRKRCDRDGVTLELQQHRRARLGVPAQAARPWVIPVCFRHLAGRHCHVVDQPVATLRLAGSCPAWIHPNAAATGYYRYEFADDDGLEQLLAKGLATLMPAEVASLAGSLRASLQTGHLQLASALPAFELLVRSRHRGALKEVIGALTELSVLLDEPALRRAYARYLQGLFDGPARSLGLEPRADEPHADHLLRPLVVELLGDVGESPWVRAQARAMVSMWLSGARPVAPSIAPEVLRVAAVNGDANLFEQLTLALGRIQAAEQRAWLLGGLGSFSRPDLLQRALRLGLSEPLTDDERLELWRAARANWRAQETVGRFVEQHYLQADAGLSGPAKLYVPLLANGRCTADRAAAVKRFFGPRARGDRHAQAILRAAVAETTACDAYRRHHLAAARDFFQPTAPGAHGPRR